MSRCNDRSYMYKVWSPEAGRYRYFLSFMPMDSWDGKEMPTEAIVGESRFGPHLSDPEHFGANPRFVAFLHEVLAIHASTCPSLQAQANVQGEGYVYILDGRTPTPMGTVPPEDIIGGISVRSGCAETYQGNPNYKVYTEAGLMRLEMFLHGKLLEETEKFAF